MSVYDILKELNNGNGTFLNPFDKKKKTTFMDYEPGKVPKKETWSKPENKKNESVKDDFLEGFNFFDDESSPQIETPISKAGSIFRGNSRTTAETLEPVNAIGRNMKPPKAVNLPYYFDNEKKAVKLPFRPGNNLTGAKYPQPDKFIEGLNYYDDEQGGDKSLIATKKNYANTSKNVKTNIENVSSGQEFRTPPVWILPKEETNDPIVRAGREYGIAVLEDIFNYGWKYALAKEHISDYSSPIYNSRYRQALLDSYIDNAKADYVAGLGSVGKFVYDVYSNADDYGTGKGIDDAPSKKASKTENTKPMYYVLGLLKTIAEGGLNDSSDMYEYLSQNNARANQSNSVLSYLENSDYKYLVDEPKAREKFIQKLKDEIEKIEKRETIGYLPEHDAAIYKKEMLDLFRRIIYLNSNYSYYGKVRDEEIKEAMENY